MTPATEVQKLNRELGNRIDKEVRENPDHPYKGKFVGIVNGQVVCVGNTLDETCDQLEQIEPVNMNRFILEAGANDAEIEYIWGLY